MSQHEPLDMKREATPDDVQELHSQFANLAADFQRRFKATVTYTLGIERISGFGLVTHTIKVKDIPAARQGTLFDVMERDPNPMNLPKRGLSGGRFSARGLDSIADMLKPDDDIDTDTGYHQSSMN